LKILCEFTPAGPSYVRSGWGRVFTAMGHDFRFWEPAKQSAFDAFGDFDPDIFIGTTYGVDRAITKNIAMRPEMKVILFGSAWGPRIESVDTKKYPIVVVSEQERGIIARLKDETGKPDFVFIHVTDKYLEPTMGGWRSIGVEPVGILNAADTFVYCGGQPLPELRCDVGFCGGYWGYKARNLNKYMLPLCHPSSGLNVKIFGNSSWPVPQYLGLCSDQDSRDLFCSATVCPSVSEPHSTDLGFDVIERPYKVLAAGGFCVSDFVDEAQEIFSSSELPMASSPEDFQMLIRHFIKNPEARSSYMEAGRRKVMEGHTYWHRVGKMFSHLGLYDENRDCLETYRITCGGPITEADFECHYV
jgi:hypothetical protein